MSLFADTDYADGTWRGAPLFQVYSALNAILDREEYTIEELLREDEVIQEVKSRNPRLVDFLSTPEQIGKLVEYILNAPSSTEDYIQSVHYPYVSCEILCAGIPCILSQLVSTPILSRLLTFTSNTEYVDLRSAGYFEKILTVLYTNQPGPLIAYLNANPNVLQEWIACMHSYSMAQLIARLLSPEGACDTMDNDMSINSFNSLMMGGFDGLNMGLTHPVEEEPSEPLPILGWTTDNVAMATMVQQLTSSKESEVHEHVGVVLVELIATILRSSPSDGHSQLHFLQQEPILESLMEAALPLANATPSAMAAAIAIVGALVSGHGNADYQDASREVPLVLTKCIARLPQICTLLRDADHSNGEITTQYQTQTPRLGLQRLKLVGLMTLLIQSKYPAVDDALVEHQVIPLCLDLFFQYELVNLLHTNVESMITTILETGSTTLRHDLLYTSTLLDRLLSACKRNDVAEKQPRGYRLGNMGHILHIFNLIQGLSSDANCDAVGTLLRDHPQWPNVVTYMASDLIRYNERACCELGGAPPSSNGMEDEPMDYSRFTGQDAILTSQFPDMLEAGALDELDEEEEEQADDVGKEQYDDEDDEGDSDYAPHSTMDAEGSDSEDEDFADFASRHQVRNDPGGGVVVEPITTMTSDDVMEAADDVMAHLDASMESGMEPSSSNDNTMQEQ